MPGSFKGADGKIVYSLEAKLSRSMRVDQKDLTKLTFVPSVDLSDGPGLGVGFQPHLLAIPEKEGVNSTHRSSELVFTFLFVLNLFSWTSFRSPNMSPKIRR